MEGDSRKGLTKCESLVVLVDEVLAVLLELTMAWRADRVGGSRLVLPGLRLGRGRSSEVEGVGARVGWRDEVMGV